MGDITQELLEGNILDADCIIKVSNCVRHECKESYMSCHSIKKLI